MASEPPSLAPPSLAHGLLAAQNAPKVKIESSLATWESNPQKSNPWELSPPSVASIPICLSLSPRPPSPPTTTSSSSSSSLSKASPSKESPQSPPALEPNFPFLKSTSPLDEGSTPSPSSPPSATLLTTLEPWDLHHWPSSLSPSSLSPSSSHKRKADEDLIYYQESSHDQDLTPKRQVQFSSSSCSSLTRRCCSRRCCCSRFLSPSTLA
jgi:hypothetical protein